jgi:TPR repeat protein
VLYLTGAGVGRDPAQAARWLQAAVAEGDSAAHADLGNLVADSDDASRGFRLKPATYSSPSQPGIPSDAGRGCGGGLRAG